MANKILPAPPEVMEPAGHGGLTCWAAALASFTSIHPKAPAKLKGRSQEDMVDDMKVMDWISEIFGKDLLLDNGALTKDGLRFMLVNAGMSIKGFPKIQDLSPYYLYNLLVNKGYLYLVLIGAGGVAHAVVVYGMINAFGANWSLSVMDPWPDNGGLVQYGKLDIREFNQAMVGWIH